MKKSPLLTLGICAALLVTDTAIGQTVKTIYFVRHAEDQLAVFPQGLNGNAYLPGRPRYAAPREPPSTPWL